MEYSASVFTMPGLFLWALLCCSLLQQVCPRPTISQSHHLYHQSTQGPPGSSPVHGDCVVHLRSRIERCLHRYQQILVTFQAPGTSQAQRTRLRTRFCHQYQVTLQCLHENLALCPPRAEHFRLIEQRIGNLRDFMTATCTAPVVPDTTSTTPQTSTTTSTAQTTTTTTTTRPTTTTPTPRTTTRPPTQVGPTVRPYYNKEFENNSFKGGYTVKNPAVVVESTSTGSSAVAGRWGADTQQGSGSTPPPSGAKATHQPPAPVHPTKFQLLFGFHGDAKTFVVSPSSLAVSNSNKLDSDMDNKIPVQVLSIQQGATIKEDTLLKDKQVSTKVDCTVDENNRIDVRCTFSGSKRLSSHFSHWSYILLIGTATYLLSLR